MMRYVLVLALLLIAVFPKIVLAHCPLCVAATGGLALLAASLGLSSAVVGIVSGSFALAMGLWFARLIQRKRLPMQDWIIALFVYLTTVLPLMPLAIEYKPLFVPFVGEYGTTYPINLFLLGALLGAGIILLAPPLSRLLTRITERHILFQQMITIGILLVLVSTVIEIIIN
ncbi:MAG: hypothetical protein A3J06_01205 [Candidatus Moranbacteria bacterium RIFCSPLOWO2_02_FULL_48_19]|nr:MAG: hypothetical protein A3J06_01205 [Candidatus Moranbacteria bacterium RIFCSPLOWO2_02_FULL_48_19]OGI32011.1 MAG: hypothetical protein A3G09_03015 [Candidatus Moranbacteria bacterium RIFCSPLOWO2_12_FULL_48_12]